MNKQEMIKYKPGDKTAAQININGALLSISLYLHQKVYFCSCIN